MASIREIIQNRPRDTKKQEYFDFWTPLNDKLEKFLGHEYMVIGFDPDFLVRCRNFIPDLSIYKEYTLTIPLEVALRL